MTERSGDTRLDFFDELPTAERQRTRSRSSRRGGGGRGARPSSGFTPLLRLAGLVAFAIVAIVLLVWVVHGCTRDAERDAYVAYMDSLRAIAGQSEQVGEDLTAALTTPGTRVADLRQKVGNLAQQQEQDVVRARELVPPGRLRLQHQQAVEALQFRVSGLRRLQDALQQSASAQDFEGGRVLAEHMRRLVASDVIWEDQFMVPTREILESQEIRGVEVPSSVFLSNADFASERAMASVWQRLQGAAAGGTPAGLHGNALVGVRAMPAGQELTPGEENVIVASADLAFEATVENSGDSQEVRVRVTLQLEQSPRPIRREQVIDLINPGERKTVQFGDLGQIVQFQQQMSMKVEVAAVPGESNLANNSATYTVIFSLSQP